MENFREILSLKHQENIALLSSQLKLSPAKLNSFIREVGKALFGSGNHLYTAVSRDCTGAIVLNLPKERDFFRGLILRTAILTIPDEDETKESIKREIELLKNFIFGNLPDDFFNFDSANRYINLIRSIPEQINQLMESKSHPFESFTASLIKNGYIDKNFNLKVSVSVMISYLKNLIIQLTERKDQLRFRICLVCLNPYILLNKAGRKTYCENCNNHRKTITKRVENYKLLLISELDDIEDDIMFYAENPEKEIKKKYESSPKANELLGFGVVTELAKRNLRNGDLKKHREIMERWHALAEPLIKKKL